MFNIGKTCFGSSHWIYVWEGSRQTENYPGSKLCPLYEQRNKMFIQLIFFFVFHYLQSSTPIIILLFRNVALV